MLIEIWTTILCTWEEDWRNTRALRVGHHISARCNRPFADRRENFTQIDRKQDDVRSVARFVENVQRMRRSRGHPGPTRGAALGSHGSLRRSRSVESIVRGYSSAEHGDVCFWLVPWSR